MTVETECDRQSLLADFGVCIIAPTGNFTAIFEPKYEAVATGGLDVESRGPALECSTADVGRLNLVKETSIEIDGEMYRVKRHEPDGTGWSVVFLKR